ncbi:FMN-binding protein, partial [Fusobacterium periodonticum]
EFRDGKGNVKGDDYGKEAGDEKYRKAQIAVEGFSTYADKLVEVQDPNEVDAVSGATVSNKEFKEAVWDALEKAKK